MLNTPDQASTLVTLSDEVISGSAYIQVTVTDIHGHSTIGSVLVEFTQATPTLTPTRTPSPISCAVQNQIPQDECDALVNLYDSTNGAGWANKTSWKLNNAPCVWYGITCTDGYVTGISLLNNNLVGTLPALPSQLQILELGVTCREHFRACPPRF